MSFVTSIFNSKNAAVEICENWARTHDERMFIQESATPSKSLELHIDSYSGAVIDSANAFARGFLAGYCWAIKPKATVRETTVRGRTTSGAPVEISFPPGVPTPFDRERPTTENASKKSGMAQAGSALGP